MPTSYEVEILDPFGNKIDVIDEWETLSYTRAVNDVGICALVLDGDYDISLLRIDGRINVWRSVGERLYIDTETSWLIRKVDRQLDQQGRRTIVVSGMSANELLKRRIIAYDGQTSQTSKSDFADDMMKEIITENFGSSASAFRDISSYLSIQGDLSLGPTVSKEFQRDNVLDVLQDISQATIQAGSPIYFDIVTATPTTFEFRTYKSQRGLDHSSPSGINPITLSPDRGSLANVKRPYDYTDEVTYVYAGQQGTGSDRVIETASSFARINQSPFNLREAFVSAGNSSGSATLQDEAKAALRAGRPRRTFEGEILDVPGSRYGVEWSWGDKVTVLFENESIDCTIDVVSISVQKGEEKIDVRLRAEES